MRIHLPTVLASVAASCLVALAVTPAANLHPASPPSQADRLAALAKRVDAIQNHDAFTRRIASGALTQAQDANAITSCITTGVYLTSDPLTGDYAQGNGTEPDATLIPVLDSSCAEHDYP